MNLTIQKCVCDVIPVTNPVQYLKFDKYKVKTKNRDWSEIDPKCGFRVFSDYLCCSRAVEKARMEAKREAAKAKVARRARSVPYSSGPPVSNGIRDNLLQHLNETEIRNEGGYRYYTG